MGDSKTLAGNVDERMGVGVAVEVGVGAKVGEGVGDGTGVGVSVSGAGVSVGASPGVSASPRWLAPAGRETGSTPAWGEGAAVAGGGVAWPGDCANEVEGW